MSMYLKTKFHSCSTVHSSDDPPDEKIFTAEETFSKQNDRVYAQSSKEARKLVPRIEQDHYPASVMFWGDSVTSLHFCEKGVKIAARNYQRNILINVVDSLN